MTIQVVRLSSYSGDAARTTAIDLIAAGLNSEVCRFKRKDAVNAYIAKMQSTHVYCFDGLEHRQVILGKLKHFLTEEEYGKSIVFYTKVAYSD